MLTRSPGSTQRRRPRRRYVDTVAELGKGTSDTDLAAYSRRTDRSILICDDDFIEDVPPPAYRATLSFEDETLTAREVATIVGSIVAVSVRRSEEVAEDGLSVAMTLLP